MVEIDCPSGAKLKITPATFADSNALYKAIAREVRTLQMSSDRTVDVNLIKDAFCILIGSDEIEKSMWKCFSRVTYNGLKVDKDTFEPDEAREDYFVVCKEVITVNVSPFLKSLYAEFLPLVAMMGKHTQK